MRSSIEFEINGSTYRVDEYPPHDIYGTPTYHIYQRVLDIDGVAHWQTVYRDVQKILCQLIFAKAGGNV
jgi:hypothetical protein